MRKSHAIALLLIISLAAFLRLYHLASTPPGLFMDEAADGNNALEITHTVPFASGFKPFYEGDNGREGLYVNVVAVLIKWTGGTHEPWVVRLPAAVFGILTVPGIYFLAAEMLGPEIALLAAFFLATSFWHINFSRIGFRAIMAPLFLVWSLYFLFLGFKKLERGLSGHAALLHVFGGLLFGLGMYTYTAYRISPAIVLLVLIHYGLIAESGGWRKRYLSSTACFLLPSILVSLPLGYYFLDHPGSFFGRAAQLSLSKSRTPWIDFMRNTVRMFGMFNFVGDRNWRHNLRSSPELFWPVGLMFLFAVFTTWKLIRNAARDMRTRRAGGDRALQRYCKIMNGDCLTCQFLLDWLLIALVPAIMADEGIPHALRSILALPPAIILSAYGGFVLYKALQRHVQPGWVAAVTIGILLFCTYHAYRSYFVVWARNPNVPAAFNADSVAIGRSLNALPAETPKYVVVPAPDLLVRGIPVSAQPTMFITDTFLPEQQRAKNIHYVLSPDEASIPAGAVTFHIQ